MYMETAKVPTKFVKNSSTEVEVIEHTGKKKHEVGTYQNMEVEKVCLSADLFVCCLFNCLCDSVTVSLCLSV